MKKSDLQPGDVVTRYVKIPATPPMPRIYNQPARSALPAITVRERLTVVELLEGRRCRVARIQKMWPRNSMDGGAYPVALISYEVKTEFEVTTTSLRSLVERPDDPKHRLGEIALMLTREEACDLIEQARSAA